MNEVERARPPGKVQIIGAAHLIAGILNLMTCMALVAYAVLMGLFTFGISLLACCPVFLLAPIGVMEIMSGIKHVGSDHRGLKPPRATAIVEIFAILCGWLSTLAGILTLAFLSDPEVAAYYEQQNGPL